MAKIESLLSGRLFLQPQVVGERIFFESNLGGQISLYAMDAGGSVPEHLIPPDLALQNPHLLPGLPYYVFPKLKKILLSLDHNGDENYQPMLVPIEGGLPEPFAAETSANQRGHAGRPDADRNILYFAAESRKESLITSYQGNLGTGKVVKLAESKWGGGADGVSEDHAKIVMIDGYRAGDNVLSLWKKGKGERKLLYGTPIEQRKPGEAIPPNGIYGCHFVDEDRGLLFVTSLFDDAGGLAYFDLGRPDEMKPVAITGAIHKGKGEFGELWHVRDDRYRVHYNIDGASWAYEGTFDLGSLRMRLDTVLVGRGELANGVLESMRYDEATDTYALAFSTATAPTQIFTLEGKKRSPVRHTRERVLGIPHSWMSAGEDASFTSFDGTRCSARLYLPAKELGFKGRRAPVSFGPRGAPRRGGGGKDRRDHVHAMTKVLPKDTRIDARNAGVVGRSYGGYMSLTLAARHPDLWSASVDMFGPYDLLTFMDRLPETWKPYFAVSVGDPTKPKDRAFLVERAPP